MQLFVRPMRRRSLLLLSAGSAFGASLVGGQASRVLLSRWLPALALLAGFSGVDVATRLPMWADSTEARCHLMLPDVSTPAETGPCWFSQRQGNVDVRFGGRDFHFPATEQGRRYQRINSAEGIRFNREGQFQLQVLWAEDSRL